MEISSLSPQYSEVTNSPDTNKLSSKFINNIEAKGDLVSWCICVVYAVVVFVLCQQKLLWNDELYTLYFARLPQWSALWAALSTGADQIPPTFILITKA